MWNSVVVLKRKNYSSPTTQVAVSERGQQFFCIYKRLFSQPGIRLTSGLLELVRGPTEVTVLSICCFLYLIWSNLHIPLCLLELGFMISLLKISYSGLMQCWGSWDGPSFGKAVRSLSGCSDIVVRGGTESVLTLLSTRSSILTAELGRGGRSLLGTGLGSKLVFWFCFWPTFGKKWGTETLLCLLLMGFWGLVSCSGCWGVILWGGGTSHGWFSAGSPCSGVKRVSCQKQILLLIHCRNYYTYWLDCV